MCEMLASHIHLIMAAKILTEGEMYMMSLLKQQYREKQEFEKLVKGVGAKHNIPIPDTLNLKKMPRELGLDTCLNSQNGNSKCETL